MPEAKEQVTPDPKGNFTLMGVVVVVAYDYLETSENTVNAKMESESLETTGEVVVTRKIRYPLSYIFRHPVAYARHLVHKQ